jgi:hypothetical protein
VNHFSHTLVLRVESELCIATQVLVRCVHHMKLLETERGVKWLCISHAAPFPAVSDDSISGISIWRGCIGPCSDPWQGRRELAG